MWAWLASSLRHNAELAVFLSLAAGYFIGPLKIAGHTLGVVTATLLTGILIGQLNIPISPPIKGFVVLLFVFAAGYKVGPQFFAGLKRDGIKQIAFALFYCTCGLAAAVLFSLAAHFNVGVAAGLLGGALTQTTTIGIADDEIGRLGLSAPVFTKLDDAMGVAFAVAYVVGTISAAIVCSRLVPALLRIDLAEDCRKLAVQMGLDTELPEGVAGAYTPNSVRAVRVRDNGMSGKSVGEIERDFADRGYRVFVAAIHRGDAISAAALSDVIAEGDVIALAGPPEILVSYTAGAEIVDRELLGKLMLEQLDVVVTNPVLNRHTVEDLLNGHARGVVLKKITRAGIDIPVLPKTVVQRGDTLKLAGFRSAVEASARGVGYAMRPSPAADIAFISAAIVIGGLIGLFTVRVGGIPLGLGTGCGALIAGIAAGYFRSRSPTFGNISPGVQWVFDSFALTVFIAIIGIEAGPGFVGGVKSMGLELALGGAAIPAICLVLAALFGRYVLKFPNVELCGALAGADTSAAGIRALQEVANSNLVTLGYTISYAVSNIILTVWGAVIVAIFATKTSI